MSRKLTTRPGSEESSEFYRIDRTRLGQTYIYIIKNGGMIFLLMRAKNETPKLNRDR